MITPSLSKSTLKNKQIMTEIQNRLLNIVKGNPFNKVLGFTLLHGADKREIETPEDVVYWIEGAPTEVKMCFLGTFWTKKWADAGLRVCSNCGQFITEGYLLPGVDYACSRECAIQNYIRDGWDADTEDNKLTPEAAEEMFDYDLETCSEDCFWTEWPQG